MSERCVCCGSEHTAIIGNYLTAMFAIAICYDCGYHVSADGETVENAKNDHGKGWKDMKAYKGFKRDMTCRKHQFEEGQTYEHQGDVKLCESGFHACEDPMDCMRYYNPCTSVYHEVEIDGVSDERKDDTSVVGQKIRIGARIGIAEMAKASVDLAFAACMGAENADAVIEHFSRQATSGDDSRQVASGNMSHQAASGDENSQAASGSYSRQAASGDDSCQAASGDWSLQAASGRNSRQAASGDDSRQAASGDWSHQAASGSWSSQVASGEWSRQAAIGDYSCQAASGGESRQAASGDDSSQAASGDESRQAAIGDYSSQVTTGKNCVMMSAGDGGSACGKIGSWIVLAEWTDGVPNVVARRIDGVEIKEDTWYQVKSGKLVEAE